MGLNPDSIFVKIVKGEIPALKVFEDEHALAFLDIGPLADGHLLLIPKEPYERLEDLPPELIAALARHLPRLAKAVMAATGATAYNVLQNNGRPSGQVVQHVHFHIIPRREGDGLGYRWNAKEYPKGRGEELAGKIIASLQANNA